MGKTTVLIITLTFNVFAQNKFGKEIVYKSSPERISMLAVDSSFNNLRTYYSGINIAGQIVVGEGIAIGLSIIPFSLGFINSFSKSDSKTASDILGVVGISAYIVGTAAGVHWIANIENKNHSFLKTLMFSTAGAGVGLVLTGIFASKYTTISDAGVTVIALCPLVGALVYSLAFAEWPEQSPTTTKYESFKMNTESLSFKDIVNQSQIVKINLFRIDL